MLNMDNYLLVLTPLLELTPGDYFMYNNTVYVYLGRNASSTAVGYQMYVMREDSQPYAHWTKDVWKGDYQFAKLQAM